MKYKRDYDDEFQWTPVTEQNYWTINLTDVRKSYSSDKTTKNSANIADSERICAEGCEAIVDTGTYLVYGPQDAMNDLLSDMNLDSCDQKKDLPDITFEFTNTGANGEKEYVEVTMTPEDYVLHFKIDG